MVLLMEKEALIDWQGLNFIGTFKKGQGVKGEIHQNGNIIFSSSLSNDKPDGNAICFYEGEYEECRFFKAKRKDKSWNGTSATGHA